MVQSKVEPTLNQNLFTLLKNCLVQLTLIRWYFWTPLLHTLTILTYNIVKFEKTLYTKDWSLLFFEGENIIGKKKSLPFHKKCLILINIKFEKGIVHKGLIRFVLWGRKYHREKKSLPFQKKCLTLINMKFEKDIVYKGLIRFVLREKIP